MSIEENKEIVRRLVEARNRHDVEAFVAMFPAAAEEHVRGAFNGTSKAFPDVHISIEELVGEGDKVVLRWTFTGTHRGLYQNIPATGKQVSYTGIDWYTIADGQIMTVVREQDNLEVLQQLGVIEGCP